MNERAKRENEESKLADLLVCDDCHNAKPDVKQTFCPYSADVHNDPSVECQLCDDCYHERCMDI